MTNWTVPARVRAGLLSAVAVAWLLTAVTVADVRAASSVEMQLRALMGGRYESGSWAAVAVTLVNDGEPTQGDVTAESTGGTVRRFVELPAGARKVVMLYVQPEAFQRQITVQYVEPNGTVEAEVEVRSLEESAAQTAIVGDGTGALRGQLAAALDESAPEPLALAPVDLPERPEPLDGMGIIIWAADSSTLTEAQRRSLERWVAAGGELVIIGGADWQARTAAFTELLPLSSLAALDGVSQAALAEWSGTAAPPAANATASSGPLREDARALATSEDGTVLLSMRSIGAGRVTLVGTDLATEDYRTWEGSPLMWGRLASSSASLVDFFGGGGGFIEEEATNAMVQALGNLPSLEVPPAELLLAVIVGYILLIGPISYLVLRRLDRREVAWVTAPVLIVLFTACSYGIGSTLKGSDVITNQISVIRTSGSGGTAEVQTYAGIFSPQRSTYDLRVDADALMAPVRANAFGGVQPRSGDVTVDQGNPAQLRDLAVSVYGFESVRADSVLDYEPSLEVTWRRDGDALIGTVTNVGSSPLSDVAYIGNLVGEAIGDLAPGQQVEFTVPRTNFNGSPAADQIYGFAGFDSTDAAARQTETRRQVINALVGYGQFMPPGVELPGSAQGPFIIGWRMEEGPAPVLIEDLDAQRYAQSVEVLTVRHPIGPGEVTIGPALMSVTVIATEGDASSGGPGMMFIGEGSATYSVTLPLEASNMTVSELTVLVGPDPHFVFSEGGGGGMFAGMWPQGFMAEIRDPQTGEWRVLGDISQDASFEIDDPATAISSGGRIEVRLIGVAVDPNFGGGSSVFVSAEVTGVIGQ